MKKRIFFVGLGFLVLVSTLAGMKVLQFGAMGKQAKAFQPPPVTVTSAPVESATWPEELTAVGSLVPVQGITVAAELAGTVAAIAFEPGGMVRKGELLLRQDTSLEEAQLPGAEAAAELARLNRDRAMRMFEEKALSAQDRDTAVAAHAQAVAAVNGLKATLAKKQLRAPFTGHLGVKLVSLGQFLKVGDPIVNLEALDPIYADFSLPQQESAKIRPGQTVRITCDALPGKTLQGRVTTVNPQVDSDTRNLKIQATLPNPGGLLHPGMFVNVALGMPAPRQVLVIPATAVLYAPYSDTVFVLEKGTGGQGLVLRQQVVRVAEKRGDLVAVATGLQAGQQVVSTGVFKLVNGMHAVVDNALAPAFKQVPTPENN